MHGKWIVKHGDYNLANRKWSDKSHNCHVIIYLFGLTSNTFLEIYINATYTLVGYLTKL